MICFENTLEITQCILFLPKALYSFHSDVNSENGNFNTLGTSQPHMFSVLILFLRTMHSKTTPKLFFLSISSPPCKQVSSQKAHYFTTMVGRDCHTLLDVYSSILCRSRIVVAFVELQHVYIALAKFAPGSWKAKPRQRSNPVIINQVLKLRLKS